MIKRPEPSRFRINPRLSALAAQLNTAPCFIADDFGVNPFYIEKLLAKRGYRCADGEMLFELVSRIYGAKCAQEMQDLIGKEPYIK